MLPKRCGNWENNAHSTFGSEDRAEIGAKEPPGNPAAPIASEAAHTAGGSMRQHRHTGGTVREHRNTCAKRSTRAQRAKACKLSLPRVGVRG